MISLLGVIVVSGENVASPARILSLCVTHLCSRWSRCTISNQLFYLLLICRSLERYNRKVTYYYQYYILLCRIYIVITIMLLLDCS